MKLRAVETESSEPAPPGEPMPSFEDLYRESRDDLFAYVAGLLRQPGIAEDVTALAFERAFRKWDRFDPTRGSARGWLFGIARNAALDELRKRKREVPLSRDQVDPDSRTRPGPASPFPVDQDLPGHQSFDGGRTDDEERAETVSAALAELPPADRELISLKFFAGLKNGEIAETTGISPTNVSTRVHRAMTRLRTACQEASR